MTLLVRDEEDIIESNIDYHLRQGVDFIIATDNLSVDSTPAILQKYQRQGKLQIIEELSDDYSQHHWVTRMARLAAIDHGADWVINNDADEFWWPEIGNNLKDCLAQTAHEIASLSVPRYNFPILESEVPNGIPFHHHLIWRDTKSENPLGNPLPPKVCHRARSDIEVSQGNHSVRCLHGLIPAPVGPLSIFHYPVRSYKQFENKIRLGGAAYARNTELDPSVGSTWRRLYESLLDGTLQCYFQQQIPDYKNRVQRIDDGRYVFDSRLSNYLLIGAE